jgi:hypothetical protein
MSKPRCHNDSGSYAGLPCLQDNRWNDRWRHGDNRYIGLRHLLQRSLCCKSLDRLISDAYGEQTAFEATIL